MNIKYISDKKILILWILSFFIWIFMKINFAETSIYFSLKLIIAYLVFIFIGIIYTHYYINKKRLNVSSILFLIYLLSGILYGLDGGSDIRKLIPPIFQGMLKNYFGLIFITSFILIIISFFKEIFIKEEKSK